MDKLIEKYKDNVVGGRIMYLAAKSVDELADKIELPDYKTNFTEGSAIYTPKKHKFKRRMKR